LNSVRLHAEGHLAMNSPSYQATPDESSSNLPSRINPALLDSPETSFPGGLQTANTVELRKPTLESPSSPPNGKFRPSLSPLGGWVGTQSGAIAIFRCETRNVKILHQIHHVSRLGRAVIADQVPRFAGIFAFFDERLRLIQFHRLCILQGRYLLKFS
jgi:hypothetical protein